MIFERLYIILILLASMAYSELIHDMVCGHDGEILIEIPIESDSENENQENNKEESKIPISFSYVTLIGDDCLSRLAIGHNSFITTGYSKQFTPPPELS